MCSKCIKNDPQKSSAFWEAVVNKYERRNSELKEKEYVLQNRLDLLDKTVPSQRVLYNMWRIMQGDPNQDSLGLGHSSHRIRSRESFTRNRVPFKSKSRERNCKVDSRERSRSPLKSTTSPSVSENLSNSESKRILQQYIRTLEEEKGQLTLQKHCMENMIKDLEMQLLEIKNAQIHQQSPTSSSCQNSEDDTFSIIGPMEFELIKTVRELKQRGVEMSKHIKIMEKREVGYLETLKQADEICADMEIGFKQHCYLAEQNEAEMRDRLQRLKRREASERRSFYGDSVFKGRNKKYTKQDHREDQKYWSMFEPICSMFNKWY